MSSLEKFALPSPESKQKEMITKVAKTCRYDPMNESGYVLKTGSTLMEETRTRANDNEQGQVKSRAKMERDPVCSVARKE
jgi:hypothetical protein